MNVTLRPARAADVSALVALEAELFGADAWNETLVAAEVREPGRVIVAVTADGVVGYAVTRGTGDVVDLLRIAVAPRWRRGGLASQLLREVRRSGVSQGAAAVLLEVSSANEGARQFYAARGFEEIDVRPAYYRDGSDALVLRATLEAPADVRSERP